MPKGCPFCDVNETYVLFGDELVFATWDRYPVSDGHLLIVTRRHVADWFSASPAEHRAILDALATGKQTVEANYDIDGFNVGTNIGEAAGQTIPHLHVHLIPRTTGDVSDPRGGVRHVIPKRGNYLRPAPAGTDLWNKREVDSLLVRGSDDPLLPQLKVAIDGAERADLAVAFILKSGVALVRDHLRDLLDRGGRVRIVTGDYLGVTDPEALLQLLDLEGDLQLRVFEAQSTSFHPKAYVFHNTDQQGTAFVGSSNLTSPALRHGVEWNYRVLHEDAQRGFADITAAFETLFVDPQTRDVDLNWVENYRKRRAGKTTTRVIEVVDDPPAVAPDPHPIQQEALASLQSTRQAGYQAGLVVLATGLGKTWLAAFDSARDAFRQVLFVAHREEILSQAMNTFRRIRPQARLGLYTGKEKTPDADVLFASIQTLGRMQHLDQFDRQRFDYIVVDEFHHASARSYRRLIEYFKPRFLLGLTATPERMDGGNLLALCQENLVYRKDLVAGIKSGLLCPFQYFGVTDEIDYANIPWRNSRFDTEELTNAVATTKRAENALQQYREHGGQRTLAFCCSQRHANFMADFFVEHGLRAVAVHAGERAAPRASAIEALQDGRLDVVFAVDMFNEGLDVPNIDTILMLRPTQSSIIWLQQFGRGLRCHEGKTDLRVIDYIGNHRAFLVKVRSLLGPLLDCGTSDAEISAAMRLLQSGQAQLPDGCEITYDLVAIDIIKSLLRLRPTDDAIIAFYDDFRERHGTRPTAAELYGSGYNPRSLRKTHGSWTKFVKAMGDLDEQELSALQSAGDFLDALESTPMTKSFKMLTLLSMINLDACPGTVGITELTEEFRRLAQRHPSFREDTKEYLGDRSHLKSMIESNPIAAWCGGKGTGGTAYFQYSNSQFSTAFPAHETGRLGFQHLVREIAEWRLAEYADRGEATATATRFVCRVIQSRGRPILKLPDRQKTQGIPAGWVEIMADNQKLMANFAKEFVNVVRTDPQAEENLLAKMLRDWFGADAGRPGTRFEISFESASDYLRLAPLGLQDVTANAESWQHYKREDIPPLFGFTFTTGAWNQGFVTKDRHVFLMVTLNKGGLSKEHQYLDHFLASDRFHWTSQNQTKQDSKHGRLIQDHHNKDVAIHLFIRKLKVLDGKAAPFVYCGRVDYESWEGEQPISVIWRLRESVPPSLRPVFDVPDDSNE